MTSQRPAKRRSRATVITCFLMLVATLFFTSGVIAEANIPRSFSFAVVNDEPPISSESNGRAVGIIPDTIKLIFSMLPEYNVQMRAYPWPRAQSLVERGELDGLLTYPSSSRKTYAIFTNQAIYNLDFGYLIHHKVSGKRLQIEAANSFDDLAGTTIITQQGAEWEQDNLPASLNRLEARNLENMLHLLLLRKAGDFFVMMPEQALYLAKKFGYQDELAYRRVNFIPESNIPFHLGIRKSHPFAERLINAVDALLETEAFRLKMVELRDRYR